MGTLNDVKEAIYKAQPVIRWAVLFFECEMLRQGTPNRRLLKAVLNPRVSCDQVYVSVSSEKNGQIV